MVWPAGRSKDAPEAGRTETPVAVMVERPNPSPAKGRRALRAIRNAKQDLKTVASPEAEVKSVVQEASAKVKGLLKEINRGTVTGARIDALLGEIKKGFTKTNWAELLQELKIAGKPKSMRDAAQKVRQVLNSQLEMHVKLQGFSGRR